MNGLRWTQMGLPAMVLMAAALLTADPARAQTPPTPGTGTGEAVPGSPRRTTINLLEEIGNDVGPKHNFANLFYDMNDLIVTRFPDPTEEILGATLQPVGETLRAQLDIPKGQGLLVASLRGEGPSAVAGLMQNDVLLSLADKPLAAADDLTKQLKAAGETTVPLQILRAGKPLAIQVRPVYRVTLGPAVSPKSEYFIGVSVEAVDDALRSQLALSAGQGVVITDVVADSPAEKAGVKKHDIVLDLGGKKIDNFETLASQVQANKDKPTTLNVLRGGKQMTIPIAGKVRKVETGSSDQAIRYWALEQQLAQPRRVDSFNRAYSYVQKPISPTSNEDLQKRLDQLDKELKALRATMEKVSEALKVDKTPKKD